MLILANSGCNFNVRNPNPAVRHGSSFRVSSDSVFMLAGAGDVRPYPRRSPAREGRRDSEYKRCASASGV
jgi:hypothetical protein